MRIFLPVLVTRWRAGAARRFQFTVHSIVYLLEIHLLVSAVFVLRPVRVTHHVALSE